MSERIKRIGRSLEGRLIFSIMVIWLPVSALVLGGLALISIHIFRETIANRTDKMRYYSAIMNTDIERVIQSLNQLCFNKTVWDFSVTWEGLEDYDSYLLYWDAYSTLKEYRNSSMYISDIFIYVPKTQEILSADRSIIPEPDLYQEMGRLCREEGVTFFDDGDDLYYLFQSSNGLLAGVKVSLRDVRYMLRGYDNGEEYLYFFINAETRELLGKKESLSELDRAVYESLDWTRETMQESGVAGNRYLIYRIGKDSNRFLIVMYIDRQYAYSGLQILTAVWGILTLLLLLVPLILAMVLRQLIKRPVDKLQYAMQLAEKENYEYQMPLDESREFNYVFAQYNRMTQKVRNLIQEILEKQLQVEQARYKQLQMQINPHFLFNSLYTGYRMAQSEDCEAVRDLCMYLGDYFSVLTFVSDEDISMENELKFVNTYLRLNKMRFGKRLIYRMDVEEKLEEYRIPPLLLQPLIENSITQGLEKCSQPCQIEVSIRKRSGRLFFSVRDDADTVSQEGIKELQIIVSQEKMPEGYFGLWNVQNRVRQLEEDNPGVLMEKDSQGWFSVSFSISCRTQ